MSFNFIKCYSLVGIKGYHLDNEISEFGGNVELIPEDIFIISAKSVSVIRLHLFKGANSQLILINRMLKKDWLIRYHFKKTYSQRKYIRFLPIIRVLIVDLRGIVLNSSAVLGNFTVLLLELGKPKVDYFDTEVLI